MAGVTTDPLGMPLLVGLVGKKRSGKDTAADILRRMDNYRPMAFAAALKEALLLMDPLVNDGLRLSHFVNLLGWEGAKTRPEVRRALQRFGDAARYLDEGIFVERTMVEVDRLIDNGRRVVISDVRRHNEADAIRAAGGVLIRLVRPQTATLDRHPSETETVEMDVHAQIQNDSDLDTLARRLALALRVWHPDTDALIAERETRTFLA